MPDEQHEPLTPEIAAQRVRQFKPKGKLEPVDKDRMRGPNEENTPGYVKGGGVLNHVSEGLVPMKAGGVNPAARITSIEAARAFAAKKRAEQQEDERVATEIPRAYVRCRACEGPAIWLVNYRPGQQLSADNWESSYKALGEPYHGRLIYCQLCWAEDKRRVPVRLIGDKEEGEAEFFTPRAYDVIPMSSEEWDALLGVVSEGGVR